MKYQKIVEALDKMLYMIWKQGISYQGTQEIAVNSDTLWNSGYFSVNVWQVTHCYLLLYEHIHSFTTAKRRLLYESNKSKLIDWYCRKIHHSKMTISAELLVCICMCICIDVCVYMYICICVYIYIYIYIYIYMHMSIMYSCICTCVCIYTC